MVGDCTRFLLCRRSPFGLLRGWRYRCPEGFHYGGARFVCCALELVARPVPWECGITWEGRKTEVEEKHWTPPAGCSPS